MLKQQLLNELVSSLRNDPDAWQYQSNSGSVIRHRNGLELWVYLGEAHVWSPHKVEFDFRGWWRLRSAYRQWRRVRGRENQQVMEDRAVSACIRALRGSTGRPQFRTML